LIEYIGIPYSFKNYNCWDHVAKVRLDNGINTKLFKPKNITNAFEIITAQMKKIDNGLTRVDSLEDFDIVVFTSKNNIPTYHCGVYCGGYVSHNDRTKRQVVMETLSVFLASYQGATFWR